MYTIQWIWPVDNLDKGIKSKTRHPLRIVWAKNHKYLGGGHFFFNYFLFVWLYWNLLVACGI